MRSENTSFTGLFGSTSFGQKIIWPTHCFVVNDLAIWSTDIWPTDIWPTAIWPTDFWPTDFWPTKDLTATAVPNVVKLFTAVIHECS